MMDSKKGFKLALITAVVSGFAVFLNKFAVEFWKDSSVFTSAKNVFVALILSSLIILFKINFKGLTSKDWIKLASLGIIGGSIPFLLFFRGLQLATAGNAAFIHKTLFLWVALLTFFFLKEKIKKVQLISLGILFGSVILLGFPSKISFGYGELLILVATLMWSIETIIAQKVMEKVPALLAAWSRMFFGGIALLIYLLSQETLTQIIPQTLSEWNWIIISSVFLLAYVTSYYSAIKHAGAAVATSVLVLAAPITIILNYAFTAGKLPQGFLLAASAALLGVTLLAAHNYFVKFIDFIKNKFIAV